MLMRGLFLPLLLAPLALASFAQKPPTVAKDAATRVTVEQLEESLADAHGGGDAALAQALGRLDLTERLSAKRLAHLKEALPGDKSKEELLIVADRSEFLDPPKDEIVEDAVPDPAATRAMLVAIVNYVNTTQRQLPNLMATRETTAFEDHPAEDSLESTGIVSVSAQPMHAVSNSSVVVTYRDRKEVVDEKATKALKQGGRVGGLVTAGEFGPILSTVVADALKGSITWGRWEEGTTGHVAVFHFTVPQAKSNYSVQFCCYVEGYGGDGQPQLAVFNEKAGYHGDITFNPADGSILRVSLQAEMPSGDIVPHAGIVIEYSPIDIGGKNYICPVHSISLLESHSTKREGMVAKTNYQGPVKTFLNDVAFTQYRRFGSETRILSSDAAP
jgi:hypothetical protein